MGLFVREGGGEGKGDLHTKKQSFPQQLGIATWARTQEKSKTNLPKTIKKGWMQFVQERDNIRRRGSCGKPLRRVHRTLHRLFGNSFDIMIYLFLFCRDTKSCSFLIRWCSECAAVQRHKILGRSLVFTK